MFHPRALFNSILFIYNWASWPVPGPLKGKSEWGKLMGSYKMYGFMATPDQEQRYQWIPYKCPLATMETESPQEEHVNWLPPITGPAYG